MKKLFFVLIILLGYTNYCKTQEPYNWSYLTDLDPERINLCTETDSNDIFVIGGWNGTDGGIGSIVKYNFTDKGWDSIAQMKTLRTNGEFATAIMGDTLYVIGGYDYPTLVETYNIVTKSWSELSSLNIGRCECEAIELNGKIYVIGGGPESTSGNTLSSVECYDPGTKSWSTVSPMHNGRSRFAIAKFNNKIYVFGGTITTPFPSQGVLSSVEEYDPNTDTWTEKSAMPTARASLYASVINNKIYVVDGQGSGDAEDDTVRSVIEVYDPAADTWDSVGTVPDGHSHGFGSSVTLDNKLYILGGAPVSVYYPDTTAEANDTTHQEQPDTTTVLNQLAYNKINIKLFPNPAKDLIELNIEGELNRKLTFNLVDITGNILRSKSGIAPKEQIMIDNLPQGFYVFLIFSEEGEQIFETKIEKIK